MTDDQLIKDLGLEGLSAEQQADALDLFDLEVGRELEKSLSVEQKQEFQRIIDEDRDFTEAWLRDNAPDYHNDPMFQQISTDSPDIWPEKQYAYIEWLRQNTDNDDSLLDRVKANFKFVPTE